MNRLQRTALNALIVVGLGGGTAAYLYFGTFKNKAAEEKKERDQARLFHFGRAHVQTAVLKAGKKELHFVQKADGFYLTKPVSWRADDEAMQAMLDRMAIMKLDPEITKEATTEELENYGLDSSVISLQVSLKDGKSHTLHVGKKNPLVNKYPVTDQDKKRLGLTHAEFYWAFDRNLESFRDKRPLGIPMDSLAQVELFKGKERYLNLQRDEKKGWKIAGPGQKLVPADAGRAHLLAVAFAKRLRSESFLDDSFDINNPEHREKYGIVPETALRVRVSNFKGETITGVMGASFETSAEQGTMVMWIEGSQSVVEVPVWIKTDFARSPQELRARTISRFEPKDVAFFELQLGTSPIVKLAKKGSKWTLEGKEDALKSWKIDEIVTTFRFFKGDELQTDSVSTAELGQWLLDPPSRRLRFFDQQRKLLGDVRVGKFFDDDHLLVMKSGSSEVFRVIAPRLVSLPSNLKELKQ